MPRPVAIQSRKAVTAKLRQLNMKSATKAPTWRAAKVKIVGQFIFWLSGMLITSVFTDPQVWKVYYSKFNRDLASDL